jgi:taurine dioxygenase
MSRADLTMGRSQTCGLTVDISGNKGVSSPPVPAGQVGLEVAEGPILEAMPDVEVVPLTTALGAEVSSVELTPHLGDAEVTALRQALLRHKVLFFRRQSLDPAALTGLARLFGEPTEAHPVEPSVEGHPEVLALDSAEGARADIWHSDLTFQERPPMGAMLHAVVVPPVGGDTIWSDMSATYEAMSPTLRGFLDGLTATHTPTKAGGYFSQRDAGGDKASRTAAAEPMHHPVVRVHPETGHRSVFVNPLFTDKIDGLRRSESDALLSVIQNVAIQPERLVRWHWTEGDVAFWDNRCTMHYALLEFTGPRRMNRVALHGECPVGVG